MEAAGPLSRVLAQDWRRAEAGPQHGVTKIDSCRSLNRRRHGRKSVRKRFDAQGGVAVDPTTADHAVRSAGNAQETAARGQWSRARAATG